MNELSMSIEFSRRRFLRGAGAGLAGTTLGALGFGDIEAAYAQAIRPYKLANTTDLFCILFPKCLAQHPGTIDYKALDCTGAFRGQDTSTPTGLMSGNDFR